MSLGKKGIIKNISTKAHISLNYSKPILDSFLNHSKLHSSNKNLVKISNFGSFVLKESPQRTGRNPKTLEEHLIPKKEKLTFKSSNKVKIHLN